MLSLFYGIHLIFFHQPEHKLQSSEGPPQVKLSSVPKMLSVLIHQWAPQAFVVSFKLETDPQLLLQKARKALEKNKHQVGSLLACKFEIQVNLVKQLVVQ